MQDVEPANADRIGHTKGATAKKRGWPAALVSFGPPADAERRGAPAEPRRDLPRLIETSPLETGRRADRGGARPVPGLRLGAGQPRRPAADARAARCATPRSWRRRAARLKGVSSSTFVVPEYHAARPKPCMGGWGAALPRRLARGQCPALPCGGDHSRPRLPDVRESLARRRSGRAARPSTHFRGTGWMTEPCRSCERREIDWGGCRCQAFAIAGDARAADPACVKSSQHAEMIALAEREAGDPPPPFIYRRPRKPASLAAAESP